MAEVDTLAINRKVCLAPMMDVTDRHFRYLCRLISPHALLYSEMITTGAVIHGQRDRLLAFSPQEQPVALQLGGNDPTRLAKCAKIAQDWGYDEVNLNVGCPSDRVQAGRFGACLMAVPELVSDCLLAMKEAVDIPVTIKTRIGIDEKDSYKDFAYFIEKIEQSGVKVIIVHARKAWLSGLSAKKNRQIPELRYDYVYRIAREHANKSFILNGGIADIESIQSHMKQVQGVMVGREAQRNPLLFAALEREIFKHSPVLNARSEILTHYIKYSLEQLATGQALRQLMRPLHGLFLGLPNASDSRRLISDLMGDKTPSLTRVETMLRALCV